MFESVEFSSLIDAELPEFEDIPALINSDPQKTVSSSDFEDKWLLIFSYPMDFTFVCPTEIKELIAKKSELDKLGVEVLLLSTDSTFTHLAWQKEIGQCPYIWAGDTSHELSTSLGILDESKGITYRATILVDPDKTIQSLQINNLAVGRNIDEIIRTVQAFQEAAKGKLLPCGWKPGDKTL